MKNLLVNGIMISVVVLVILKLKESDFGKRFKNFLFEEQDGDEEIVLADSKKDKADSAEAKPADSKTDEVKPAESKTDEADSAEADSTDSKTDSEELPDFLEYERNEEIKKLNMQEVYIHKKVAKSFIKKKKNLELKTKSKDKNLEAQTDEYVIFSIKELNNPQSQYSPYSDKDDADSADFKKDNGKH